MQKISPFLWFEDQAEEAAQFYTSIFKNSKIHNVARYGEGTAGTPGKVTVVSFEIEGQQFTALNGGPTFSFTPAISFYVDCETQQEVDYLWARLTEDGHEDQCGWLRDKYGVSWQIVPGVLGRLMSDPDPEKARRVTEAMLKMVKLDIATLQRAYEGS